MKSNFEIFSRIKDPLDIWSVMVHIPSIELYKTHTSDFGDEYKKFELNFDNRLCFHRETDGTFWYFRVKVLGFGISVSRQKGY